MNYCLRRSAILLLTFGILQSCSSSTPHDAPKKLVDNAKKDSIALIYNPANGNKKIDAFMKELHRKYAFNGNVLVAQKGKIIYENAIGWADYLHRDSLKINSAFELASVSKPFTSTAIMMLVEEKKLKLSQDVREFFPDFPYSGITVKMLLSHRSGMMNYVYFTDNIWKSEHRDERKGMTNQEVMGLIAKYKPAAYTRPNQRFHYNNSNFMVLAAIIEKVTGKPYANFMKERIFKPAGMKNTNVYSKAVYSKIPVDVVGHDRVWRRSVAQNFLDGPVGDKGIYSTVHDLYLFDRAMRENRLIKKQSQDSAYAAHNDMIRGHFNYGYGWRTFKGDGHQIVYHTGWWHGFRHIYVRDLNKDITVILLSNLTNGSLLKLDELYKMLDMPVIRKGAYSATAIAADDED